MVLQINNPRQCRHPFQGPRGLGRRPSNKRMQDQPSINLLLHLLYLFLASIRGRFQTLAQASLRTLSATAMRTRRKGNQYRLPLTMKERSLKSVNLLHWTSCLKLHAKHGLHQEQKARVCDQLMYLRSELVLMTGHQHPEKAKTCFHLSWTATAKWQENLARLLPHHIKKDLKHCVERVQHKEAWMTMIGRQKQRHSRNYCCIHRVRILPLPQLQDRT